MMSPFLRYLTLIWVALSWGALWALALQLTAIGRWIAIRRTWIAVVVGVGGDLIIALAAIPWEYWRDLAIIVACSAIPIVARSLINEHRETQEELDALADQARQ